MTDFNGLSEKEIRDRIKKIEISIGYHRKALSFCPDDFPYRTNIESSRTEEYAQMGHCHYQLRDFDAAIDAYTRARSTDPDHLQTLYQLGLSHLHQNLFEEAREFFHEMIERVYHAYDKYHRQDALLQIARTYIEEGKENGLIKAEKFIVLVADEAPQHPMLPEIRAAYQKQQNVISLIKQVKRYLSEHQWRWANKNILELKRIAPNHPDVLKLEKTLRATVSNSAFEIYTGKLFANLSQKSNSEQLTYNETPTP